MKFAQVTRYCKNVLLNYCLVDDVESDQNQINKTKQTNFYITSATLFRVTKKAQNIS